MQLLNLNLASNALMSFGIYDQPTLDFKMCVLEYRKLFAMDKSKVQSIINRINRALAKSKSSFPELKMIQR